MPEIDLAFAISAAASNSDKTFKRIKDTINTIINKYGTEQIRYALVVFGSSATTAVSFREQFASRKDLTTYLSLARQERGEPDIVKAFDEVKRLFDSAPSRSNAKKVVVVVVDKVRGY